MLSYHHREAPPPPPPANILPSNQPYSHFKSVSSNSHAAARAMATTHLRHGSRPKPPPNRPFDPEDLSRRLTVVLAEQQAREKKKRTRVFASISSAGGRGSQPREVEVRERWGLLTGSTSAAAAAAAGGGGGVGNQERRSARAMKTRSFENFRSGSAAETRQEAKKAHRASKDGHNVLTKKYSNPELARRSSSQQSMRDATGKHVSSQAVASKQGVASSPLIDRIDARQASWKGLNMRLQEVDEEKPIETVAATDVPVVKYQPAQRYRSVRKSQSHRENLYERGNTPTPHVTQQKEDGSGGRDHKRQNRNASDGAIPKANSRGHGPKPMRRSSTDELYRPHDTPVEEDGDDTSPFARGRAQTAEGYYPELANRHRPADWTQGDEKKKPRMPLLKKADSLLGLKTKFGGFSSKHGREEKVIAAEHWREHDDSSNFQSDDSPLSPKSPKSPRSRFFWPFKKMS